jgi:hypothetical protein
MPIYENMPQDDYFSIEAASNSGLKKLLRSPAHFKYPEPEADDTRGKQIGRAIHMAILEPDQFAARYKIAEADDRVSAYYKGLAKDLGGEWVLTRPEARRITGMQSSAYRNKRFASYMESMGRNELTVVSKDPVTGVPAKCRFDRKGDANWAFDLKKCQDARVDEFCKAIGNYGYYMQVAFYAAVWEWETGEKMNCSRDFPIVAIEENSPHGCLLHDLDEVAIELGRRHFRAGMETYARCLDQGYWPPYFEERDGALVRAESVINSVPNWLARELTDDEDFGGV